ncbi:hypothetical protein [Parasitella parasitica]|uniref:Transcription activator GCR1-like domain-containing protein n=1 Tax=Parasitella parasitica TaxID=35722 RepID=A0A0B7N2M8_9FUNG|nr:hypothetical protein [Parasitella parasitica]
MVFAKTYLFLLNNHPFSQPLAFQSNGSQQLDSRHEGFSSETPVGNSSAPPYVTNRKIVTVVDLWREYTVGLDGGPSIKELEAQYGTTWRKDRKESQFFSRRNELQYNYIKKNANDRLPCEEIAKRLEEQRVHLNLSIDKLVSSMSIYPLKMVNVF